MRAELGVARGRNASGYGRAFQPNSQPGEAGPWSNKTCTKTPTFRLFCLCESFPGFPFFFTFTHSHYPFV